ncbi:MAG: undecaprenyl/decaprenyl-phosphate alpha-N-acetylglucosaminyl 1-phosphate transferase [Phycisphaerales bacterium]|nr:MAG: undecaprenyl/decaprenyl-phosphate alpha-N-acetylglucosaminyl 1-phosphate transferase [Phycisphaerales bacterium]
MPATPAIWILALVPLAFAIAAPLCGLVYRLSLCLGAIDTPGVAGQVKAPARRVPNTGGVGVFWAIAIPLGLGLIALTVFGGTLGARLPESAAEHLPGARERVPLGVVLLISLAVLHAVGLLDDRRPLGPWIKLGVMLACGLGVALTQETRLLTVLDERVGGSWLSIGLTVLWFAVVTNALNFLDNMDGLSAGVTAIAGGCFLATALLGGQWFVAAVLALLVGACLGFLVWNFPRAKLFLGDGGSLVLGFLLAFLTVRTTYFTDQPGVLGIASHPSVVLLPLVVLAVPIYDFVTVTAIRLSQGRSPFVGDLQHLSHRLVRRGLSRTNAVIVIWGFTGATGLAGIALGAADGWAATVIFAQVALLLGVLAVFEYASSAGIEPAP